MHYGNLRGSSLGEGNGTPFQYSCLENPTDRGAWQAAVNGVAENWTRLSDFTFTFHFHALEKEMATHASVLAWRIPGTGEPGGLPSMGSHRVGHDWSDLAEAAAKNNFFLNFYFEDKKKIIISSFLLVQGVYHSPGSFKTCFREEGQGDEVSMTFQFLPFSQTSSA